jgi:hypothetical protein
MAWVLPARAPSAGKAGVRGESPLAPDGPDHVTGGRTTASLPPVTFGRKKL